MKILVLIALLLPCIIHAGEIELVQGQKYTVPTGKVWVLENAPYIECRVCTSDVYVEGEISNVEIGGIIFHGAFDFNIANKEHDTVKFFSGSVIWLGDSRSTLIINELEK